jgi:peptidoglycan/LPS O-acetylase OafA/YrhL
MTSQQGARISTLDGWRGVAILLVLADHASHFTRFDTQRWANMGSFGVDIFFVLSGYIITLRFIEEREKSSTVSLHSFYVRRAFRILPLVVTYLTTICVLSLFMNLIDFHASEIAGSLFFYRNYQHAANPAGIYTTHFWSLSIEEHFYLLWPALFLFLGNKRALWFALIGALGCAMWRLYDCTHPDSWIGRFLPGASPVFRASRTDARFDGLLLGCALAILLSRPVVCSFVTRNFPKETPLVMAFLLILNLQRTNYWPSLSTYLIVAVMLGSTLVVQEGLAHKWLNTRLLVWIGTISYSVYVWQEMFLIRPAVRLYPFGRLSAFPLNLVCVFAISAISFYFVERPCIAYGKRMLARKREHLATPTGVSLT